MKGYLAVMALVMAPVACAQTPNLGVFDRLKDKASEVTDMNLNKDLLGLGASFLGADKGDTAKVKKLAEGLNSIVIKSLEFEKEGVYSKADVQQLITELGGPGWNLIISSEEKKSHEIARIWIKAANNGEVGGMRILSAEPKELAVIEITGRVRLEDLKDLGALGVPDVASEHGQAPKKNQE